MGPPTAVRPLSSPTHTPNLQKMQGGFFAGRRVEAYLYAGQWFKISKGEDDGTLGDGADSERRLDGFAQRLINEGEA